MIKRIALIWGVGILLFAGIMLFAQTAHPVAQKDDAKIGADLVTKEKPCPLGQALKVDGTCETPAPTLTATETIALAALEEKKQAAQQQWLGLEKQEQQVLAEWAAQHKGWKIDPQQGFKVVKDEPKKEEKK